MYLVTIFLLSLALAYSHAATRSCGLAPCQPTHPFTYAQTCTVSPYVGVMFKLGNMLSADGYWVADTLQDCVKLCLQASGCVAVNYLDKQKLCAALSDGIWDGWDSVDPSNYVMDTECIHAYITCTSAPILPCGTGTCTASGTVVGSGGNVQGPVIVVPPPAGGVDGSGTVSGEPAGGSASGNIPGGPAGGSASGNVPGGPAGGSASGNVPSGPGGGSGSGSVTPTVCGGSGTAGSPVVSCGCGCGKQANIFQPRGLFTRVIGGTEARPHSWPWLVTLNIHKTGSPFVVCGGNLVRLRDNDDRSDIVITAAQCVTEEKTMATSPRKISVDQVNVVAGNHHREYYEAGEEKRDVCEIRFHSGFRFTETSGAINDIAILKLSTPIKFSDTIRPICFPQPGEALPIGKTCIAAGWGRNNSRSMDLSPTLQQLTHPVHDARRCAKGWGSAYKEETQICAGNLQGTSSTCRGDSGGALACLQPDGSWTMYGVRSFGISPTCLKPGMPSIFTRVSSYLDWITYNMREMTAL